ncbi:MAG: hypothetical protein KME03_05860 [Aphanocapsa lilacina HA4352-LM1]|nr:hypothetical protein [Aphanocapsa lilacina HA4352-LM1]
MTVSLAAGSLPTQVPGAQGLIAVYYEHPRWFEPLFAELERRGTPYLKMPAAGRFYDPANLAAERGVGLVFNRMSPSAYRRGGGRHIHYTLGWLAHLEGQGLRVVNGERAFRHEISKALQLSLLRALGLPFPHAHVFCRAADAPRAAVGLRFPVVVKPNVGGSGTGVTRFDAPEQLAEAAHGDALDLGLDSVALVQEFVPARGSFITRVEVVGGKFLYAIRVHLSGETFDLCPADICRTTGGEALGTACPTEAPKAGLRVEGYEPPQSVIADVERIVAAAGIEVGGVEYLVDDRDGRIYYYDINALSNFVSDGERVVGFDPFVRLVDFLEREAGFGH